MNSKLAYEYFNSLERENEALKEANEKQRRLIDNLTARLVALTGIHPKPVANEPIAEVPIAEIKSEVVSVVEEEPSTATSSPQPYPSDDDDVSITDGGNFVRFYVDGYSHEFPKISLGKGRLSAEKEKTLMDTFESMHKKGIPVNEQTLRMLGMSKSAARSRSVKFNKAKAQAQAQAQDQAQQSSAPALPLKPIDEGLEEDVEVELIDTDIPMKKIPHDDGTRPGEWVAGKMKDGQVVYASQDFGWMTFRVGDEVFEVKAGTGATEEEEIADIYSKMALMKFEGLPVTVDILCRLGLDKQTAQEWMKDPRVSSAEFG